MCKWSESTHISMYVQMKWEHTHINVCANEVRAHTFYCLIKWSESTHILMYEQMKWEHTHFNVCANEVRAHTF